MPESSPSPRPGPEEGRSLHRINDAFRPRTDQRPSSNLDLNESGGSGATGLGITSEPDVRTRLLDSYDRSGPVCGERRCSHGTFSPRLESTERQSFLGSSSGRFGYPGSGDAGTASSHFRGGDDPPGSRPDSEYTSQMKSSLSGLSVNEHKKLYAGCLFLTRTSVARP